MEPQYRNWLYGSEDQSNNNMRENYRHIQRQNAACHQLVVWSKHAISLLSGPSLPSACCLVQACHQLVVWSKLAISLLSGPSLPSACFLVQACHQLVVWPKLAISLLPGPSLPSACCLVHHVR
jgi:hypothetical protein